MQKKEKAESDLSFTIVWNMPSECCCRVSEVSIDLNFEWIDPSAKSWNFILYCYETKEKTREKLEQKETERKREEGKKNVELRPQSNTTLN